MWLTEELKQNIKRVFEPRYNRQLSNGEVETIADNLTEGMEVLCKFTWRKKYENRISRP